MSRISKALAGAAVLSAAAGTATAQFSDNFDSYTAGSTIAGQGGWAVWCTGGSDAVVSTDFALSPSNSLRLDATSDIVQQFVGVNSGQWVYVCYTYMPSSATGGGTVDGWINLMNTYCQGSAQTMHWSTATKFSLIQGVVQSWTGEQLPLQTDKWVEYRCEFDLTNDTFSEYYDGQQLTSNKQWTTNVSAGGLLECQAVDLYSDTVNGFYIDDVVLKKGGCYPDCDGSGSLDLFDFLCFVNEFNNGDPYADCDGSGSLDLFDFLCFVNEFNNGC